MRSPAIKAIVFDVGNTLWFEATRTSEKQIARMQAERVRPLLRQWQVELTDSLEDVMLEIWGAYLEAASREESRGSFRDPSLPFLIRGAMATRGLELTQEQAEEWWRTAWISEKQFGVQLYPDTLDVLEALKALGVLIGINTNRPCTAEMHRRGLEEIGIARYCDAIVCSGDTGFYKPHPSTFELILDRLGTAAAETVMVGDLCRNDVIGAKQAGMITVWKLSGRYGLDPCPDADFTIHELSELLGLPFLGPSSSTLRSESPTPHEDENEDRY